MTKSIAFCAVLVVLLAMADFVLRPTSANPNVVPWAALEETRGEADVLVLGSSRAHCSLLPMEMWRHAGITAVAVTSGGQIIPATLAYFEQALRYQKPKVVLVEVSMAGARSVFRDLPRAHSNFDDMPAGLPKAAGILRSVSPTAWPEFFFSLQIYHSRWRSLTRDDFLPDKRSRYAFARGAHYLPVIQPQSGIPSYTSRSETEYRRDLPLFQEMARLCERNGTQLVLFSAPSWERVRVGDLPLLERLKSDLDSEYPSVDYVDMDRVAESIGVDPSADYYDKSHLNHRGATKLSLWLAEHLSTRYAVPDRHNEAFASRWSRDLQRYDEVFVSGW